MKNLEKQDSKRFGKAFIDVAPAGRLNVAWNLSFSEISVAGPPVRVVTLVPRCGWPRWSKIESNPPPNLLISRRLVL